MNILHIFFLMLYCSAWLTGYEHPVIETINQRIEDLTGLEMDTAEELQVNGFKTNNSQGALTHVPYVYCHPD